MNARVINLEPSGERWDGFVASAAAAGLPFTRFPAVNTLAISPDSHEARQVAHGPGTLKAMIGCTLSHLALWEECAASGETMLVLEDDARFVDGVWDAAPVASVAPETDVLLLQSIHTEVEPGPDPVIPIRPDFWFTTCAYRLTPRGAAALLAYCRRPWTAADGDVPVHQWEGETSRYHVPYIVDYFLHRVAITGDVNVRLMVPNPVAHSGLESTIIESDYLLPPLPAPEVRPVPFELRKAETLRSLGRIANQRLAAGVEAGGITLAAGEKDQEAFTRLLTLLREAHEIQPDDAAKAAFLATPQVITDLNGTPHLLPDVPSLRQLLVSYGAAVRELWTEHATRRAAVAAATTDEELAAAVAGD